MKTVYAKSYLSIAGLVMMMVGIYIAINTADYMAAMTTLNAENLEPSINMLSDLRGMGGMLFVLGTYVSISVFQQEWQKPALMIGTLVYAAFVLFRSLGFIVDGLPEMTIMLAYLIEMVLAALGVLLLRAKAFDASTCEDTNTRESLAL